MATSRTSAALERPLAAAPRDRRAVPSKSAPAGDAPPDARTALLDAAEAGLRDHGYAGLSTRRVADAAGVPLSQIHYHFGSKESMVLALLERQNERLLRRQHAMFGAHVPLWQRWGRACDFLDEDLASGYVRVLQETIAMGWSSPEIATAVRDALRGWYALLAGIADEAAARFGNLGSFTADELAALIGNAFIGSETMLLLGFEHDGMPVRHALRRVGTLIRALEERTAPTTVPKTKPKRIRAR
jgi:AcrR family transcriptional regulator